MVMWLKCSRQIQKLLRRSIVDALGRPFQILGRAGVWYYWWRQTSSHAEVDCGVAPLDKDQVVKAMCDKWAPTGAKLSARFQVGSVQKQLNSLLQACKLMATTPQRYVENLRRAMPSAVDSSLRPKRPSTTTRALHLAALRFWAPRPPASSPRGPPQPRACYTCAALLSTAEPKSLAALRFWAQQPPASSPRGHPLLVPERLHLDKVDEGDVGSHGQAWFEDAAGHLSCF